MVMTKNPFNPEFQMTDEAAFERLFRRLEQGGEGLTKTRIAQIVGVSKQAIAKWRTIPAKYVTIIHQGTNVPKSELRPSDFS